MLARQDLLKLMLDFGGHGLRIRHQPLRVVPRLGPVPSLGRLEFVPDLAVVTLPVAGQLDGVELDLGHDYAVGLRIISRGVHPEKSCPAVVLDMLERLAKLAPILRGKKTIQ